MRAALFAKNRPERTICNRSCQWIAITKTGVWIAELRCVGQVKDFATEDQAQGLTNREDTFRGKVDASCWPGPRTIPTPEFPKSSSAIDVLLGACGARVNAAGFR